MALLGAATLAALATAGTPAPGPAASGAPDVPVRLLAVSAEPGPLPERTPDGLVRTVQPGAARGGVGVVAAGSVTATGIPARVLEAYHAAALTTALSDPTCGLPWWLLAGIGRVESGHAAGGRVDAAGRTRGEILGPRLDGSLAGTKVIGDSDGGALDGDAAYDRAVGPMQFLPGTWRGFGADGDGDGSADPHDIDDAAAAAAGYLCAGGADLTTEAGMVRAVLRYNASRSYVEKVLSWGYAYRDGARPVPGQQGVIQAAVRRPLGPVAPPARVAAAVSDDAPTSSPGAAPVPSTSPTASTSPSPTFTSPTSPATSSPSTTSPSTTSPTTSPTDSPTTSPTDPTTAPEPSATCPPSEPTDSAATEPTATAEPTAEPTASEPTATADPGAEPPSDTTDPCGEPAPAPPGDTAQPAGTEATEETGAP
ncbi:MAG: lytic murein transglycosylase [Actinomycetes bacterium]